MKCVNDAREIILGNLDHFVFTLVDGPFDTIGFVVVHRIAHRESTHEIADAGLASAEIFPEY